MLGLPLVRPPAVAHEKPTPAKAAMLRRTPDGSLSERGNEREARFPSLLLIRFTSALLLLRRLAHGHLGRPEQLGHLGGEQLGVLAVLGAAGQNLDHLAALADEDV